MQTAKKAEKVEEKQDDHQGGFQDYDTVRHLHRAAPSSPPMRFEVAGLEQEVVKKRPDDQLNLTEAELDKEENKILQAKNPNAPSNIVRYSYKDRTWKLDPSVEQMETHYSCEGSLLHKDTDEAKRITLAADADKDAKEKAKQAEAESAYISAAMGGDDDEDQQDSKVEPESKLPRIPSALHPSAFAACPTIVLRDDRVQTLRNQFNFSERASQTFNNPLRDRATATEPPPSVTFSATATQVRLQATARLT